MSHLAADLSIPSQAAARDQVIYEQPLNERMRTFLRLEFLFRQAGHFADGPSSWESRAAVASLLDILAILNRGDVRGDLLKELERHGSALAKFNQLPGVDGNRLAGLLSNIEDARGKLGEAGKLLTNGLRECEFLSSIKHRSAIPGGTCEFDLPDYSHWLSRPHERRKADFDSWLDHLQPLGGAVRNVLWLTRESADPRSETANAGMFQHNLERAAPCQLLRVGLPTQSTLFPEISGGHHRFTVRFRSWNVVSERAELVTDDVEFLLSCC